MTFLIKELINEAVKGFVACSPPKKTQLIIDLIKYSDNYVKNILCWAIGNTLVTKQLDTAMKVAYYDEKSYRVITTKG